MSKHRITSIEPLKRLRRTLVKNHCGRCFAAFFRGGYFATFLEGGPGATAPLAPYKNHHCLCETESIPPTVQTIFRKLKSMQSFENSRNYNDALKF